MVIIPWLLGIVLVVCGVIALRRRETWGGIALIVLGLIVVPGGLWIFD